MSRIGRMFPLGAALLLVSCADGTGPLLDQEQQPLGAITGPGISAADLKPLAHDMAIVTPGGLPLFSVAAGASGGVPQLESDELSFWAKHGEPRGVQVNYAADGGASNLHH